MIALTASTRDQAVGRLFEVAREGIYVGLLHSADAGSAGVSLLANPCLRRILGYADGVDHGTVLLFAQAHYADSSAREQLVSALLAGDGASDHLLQLRRCDGQPVWVEVTACTEVAPDGTVLVDAFVRDVTERRHLESRARELYRQLAHSEQIAAIDRTLADVAHELRNPLASIVGWAERVAQLPLEEKARKGITEILSASERAGRIIRTALHSAGRQQSTRAMVDINAVVSETLALRQHEQRSMNVTTETELGSGLPPVFADAHQVQQVLLNVIINAEHAMTSAHDRGTLTVRTMADDRRHVVVVEISDDGPGVPESVRSRIFDPFFSTKQVRSGTGLGLAVAQALAHEHGGSLRLAHERSDGATFVIELPTRDATREAP